MIPEDAIRVVREQTIPGLRASGGDGHADAVVALLSACEERGREVERLEKAHAYSEASFAVAQAEVERLRAENAALTQQWNMKQETCAELRASLNRVLYHWPHIEVGRKWTDGKWETHDPGAPTCLRCKIEGLIAAAQPEEGVTPTPLQGGGGDEQAG